MWRERCLRGKWRSCPERIKWKGGAKESRHEGMLWSPSSRMSTLSGAWRVWQKSRMDDYQLVIWNTTIGPKISTHCIKIELTILIMMLWFCYHLQYYLVTSDDQDLHAGPLLSHSISLDGDKRHELIANRCLLCSCFSSQATFWIK